MNQAYSRLSTTHGHITDCKLAAALKRCKGFKGLNGLVNLEYLPDMVCGIRS